MSANTMHLGSTLPTELLEAYASEQRRKIHESVLELRSHVNEALDVRRLARRHMVPLSATVAGAGLFLGYGLVGMLRRR
jgi:hypothetical protein